MLAVPLVVSARHGQDLEDVFFTILNLVNLLALIVIALAVLYFFWGVARYILSAGSDKEEGKSIMVWGIIAIFVMVSIWGLIRLLQNTFSVTDNNAIIPAEVQAWWRR